MATPEQIAAFAQQYGPLVADTAARYRLNPQQMLSQIALETGYGKSVIPGTNNPGNLKQTGGGGVAAIDNALGTSGNYQQFPSMAAGVDAMGSLLARRYGGGSNLSGYAEDPNYAGKISGVGQTLQKYASNVLGMMTGSTSANAGELTPAQRAYASAANGPTPPPTAKGAQAAQQQAAPQGDPWAAFKKDYGAPAPASSGGSDDSGQPAASADPWAGLKKDYGAPQDSAGATAPAASTPAPDMWAGVRSKYSDAGKTPAAAAAATAPAPAAATMPTSPTAPTTATTTQGAPDDPQRGFLGDLGHQLGLTGRMGVTGVSALPNFIGDTVNTGINAATGAVNKFLGTSIPALQTPSSATQELMNRAGVAQPENAKERVVQDVGSAMVGAATGSAAGSALKGLAAAPQFTTAAGQAAPSLLDSLAQRSAPALQTVGDMMSAKTGTQIASAAGGAAGSSIPREAGMNAGWQIGGGLLGSLVGAGGAGLADSMITSRQDAAQRALLAANPEFQQQQADAAMQRITGGSSDLPPTARRALAPTPDADQTGALARAALDNPNVDTTQLQRAQDFRALGMDPTTGQISRDPTQFAKEQNMRASQTQLATRFNQQDRQLGNALDGLSNQTALDAYQAGSGTKTTLQNIDEQMRQGVTDAYTTARQSAGARLDVPTQGLAQDYARVLDEFGTAIPSGVRNQFEKLGLMDGTQRQIFDMDDANKLTQIINKNVGNDRTANTALGELRTAVNNAVQGADDQGGVFAPAKALAQQRFQLQDAIPALKDAATDATAADRFMQKYVIGGNTEDVQGLSNLLQQHAPDQFQQLRSQVVQKLQDAAYGGGEEFKPAAFAKQMDAFGPQKLGAFFSPDDIEQLKTIGRVGSYMNTTPSSAAVNFSNSATSLLGALSDNGLVSKIPWVGGLAGKAADRAFARQALQGGFQQMAPAALAGPTSTPGLLGLLGAAGAANRTPNR
jgi:hypothetical protein